MSDLDQQPQAGGEVSQEPDKKEAAGTQTGQESVLLGEAFLQKELQEARKDAAKNRIRAKDAEKKLAEIERAKLEADGNWQKLYEQAKSDLSVREQELEQHGAYKTAFQTVLQRRIDSIPEANRGLVPTDYDPIKLSDWLDANWQRLASPRFPNLDPGAGTAAGSGGGNNNATLSPQAQEMARRLGIPADKAREIYKGK